MNKSRIEWCDHTWNPITGCRYGCTYCYARTMTSRFAGDVRLNKTAKADYKLVEAADGSGHVYVLDKPMLNETGHPLVYPFGFEPTYHRYRMDTLDKLKMGNNIFVGAMADVFGAWVPYSWIEEVFRTCEKAPQHNYLFLTKNPFRYELLHQSGILRKSSNMWYGYSATNDNCDYWFDSQYNTFVSIEPILEPIKVFFGKWVIIGAETGRRKGRIIPQAEWIADIVDQCDKGGIPVFMKNSLIPIVGEANMRRDFPEQLQHSTMSPKMEAKTYDICAECKARLKKRDMITLLARSKRGEQPKQFGFMCRECFNSFCQGLGLDVPLLAELADSITMGGADE